MVFILAGHDTYVMTDSNKNSPSKKLFSVIFEPSVSLSVIHLLMNLQMDKAHQKKKYSLYYVNISIGKYNISPT